MPKRTRKSSMQAKGATYKRTLSRIASSLHELRLMHGLSLPELGERAGVNWRLISDLECGDPRNPPLSKLAAIAWALGIEPHQLLTRPSSGIRRKPAPRRRRRRIAATDNAATPANDNASGADESESTEARNTPQSAAFGRAMRALAVRLRRLREARGWSRADLHAESGVNWRQIVQFEQGEPANPILVTLTRLADALDVDVHELVTPLDDLESNGGDDEESTDETSADP